MATADHLQTVFIITAVGPDAAEAMHLPHNAHLLQSVHNDVIGSGYEAEIASASREATPYFSRPSKPELHVKFDLMPKDRSRGFIFGSDDEVCDFLLDNSNARGISGRHFSIDFNWDSGFLRVTNLSRLGTYVEAPSIGERAIKLKGNERRMHPPAEVTKISVGAVDLELRVPNRGNYQGEYDKNWIAYRRKFQDAIPGIQQLNIQPSKSTKVIIRRKGLKNIYLLHQEIGRGEYGTVHKATDYYTGDLFAAKQFIAKGSRWDDKAKSEIGIIQKVSHEHIVKYEDHVIDEAGLILVMEYLPLGNLMQLNQSQKLSKEEARTCLRQILQALKYLHSLFITHRDIKPANILILYREPELFVKVTDFGLSKEGCFLSSHCGTAAYVAAEVYTGYYTNSVDIWSTGVVALELIEGLPRKESDHTAWSKKVRRAVDRLNRRANDPLSQILEKMLQLDPNDRMSAEDCLREPWVQKNGPSWRSSGIIEQATEIIEPAPEVEMTGGIDRHLEESSFDDEAPTQIWNPPVGAVGDERLPPTQRGDCTEDENGDEWLRPVQREKVYEEEEADEGEEVISATRKVTRRQLKRPHDETPDMESTPTQQKRVSREQFHPKNLTENRLGYVQMTVNGKPVSMRKSDYWLNATQLLVLAGKKENERKTILDALKKETTVQVQTAAKGFGHATSWVCYVDGRSLCDTLHVTDLLSALLEYPPEETKIEAQKAGRSKFPIDKFIEVSTGTGSSTVSIRRVDFWTNASNILKEAGQNKVATRSKLSNIRSRGIVIDVIRAGQKHQGSYIEFSEGLKLCDEYSLSSLKEVLQKTKGSLTVQRIGRHRQEENPQTWNRPVNDIRGDKAYQIEQEPNQQVDEDEKADEREDDECGLAAPTTPSTPIQRRRSSLQAYFQNEKDQSQSQYITIRTGTNFNIVSIRRADLWINATDILREAGVYTNRTRIFSAMRKAGVQMEHKRGSMARGMYMPYQEGLNLCTKHELAPLKVLLQRTKEGLAFKTTGDPGLEGDHERDGAYDEGANEDEGDEDEGGEDEEADEVEGVDADEEAEFTEISYGIRLDGNSAELHVAAAVSETSGSVPIAHGSRSSFLAKGNLSNSSFVSQSSVSGSDSNCVTYGIGPLGFDSSWIEELIR